jgi:hypothetical protein
MDIPNLGTNMTSQITINDQLIEAATNELNANEGIDEAVLVSGGGITAVLSPRKEDMLVALHPIEHGGKTYYLGLPHN